MCETIEDRYIGTARETYYVFIEPDTEVTPWEYDCYTPDQIEAWKRDEWRFVILTVRIEGTSRQATLGAIEYGDLGDVTIGMDEIIEEHFNDLCDDL